jgi:hypothetical protein
MLGPDPDVAVQSPRLVPDPDDQGPAALAADGDLALLQVEVAAAGVVPG